MPDSVFYTSAMATADFLRRQEGKKAYVVGEGALIHELYKAGFTITDVNPDFVIVGETRSYNWDMMHKAAFSSPMARALSPPTRIPTVAAFIRPAARCAQALKNFRPEAVLCRQTQPVDHPRGIKQNAGALGRDRYRRRQPAHRHSGGVRAGLETILVLSGVSTINDIDSMPFRPSWIYPSVAEIDVI